MTFQTGEQILLKVSPIKGIMGFYKNGKLSPCYIILFSILSSLGPVIYKLTLPPILSRVHPVFHVFMLKKCHGDGDYVIK